MHWSICSETAGGRADGYEAKVVWEFEGCQVDVEEIVTTVQKSLQFSQNNYVVVELGW